jgi:hypothetical protein
MVKQKSTTPKHKRLNRESRLQAAKSWLVKYNGKNTVRGYSKHFGVDLLCAVHELKLLGIFVEEKYIKQLEIDKERRTINKQLKKEKRELEEYYGQEVYDYLINEYTENGLSYDCLDDKDLEEDEEKLRDCCSKFEEGDYF